MTAKDKANELVFKYIDENLVKDSCLCDDLQVEVYSSEVQLKNAKHCAIILVGNVVDETPNDRLIFWLEVINEIVKL